jgi:hypothetical protein
MKAFAIWLAITLGVFGAASGGYHMYLTENPRRILVVVDSSFPMTSVWRQLPGVLAGLSRDRYTSYSLMTEKNKVHGWSPRLSLKGVTPYAPRDFSKLAGGGNYPEIDQATETYFVTNAGPALIENLPNWRIIRLDR